MVPYWGTSPCKGWLHVPAHLSRASGHDVIEERVALVARVQPQVDLQAEGRTHSSGEQEAAIGRRKGSAVG